MATYDDPGILVASHNSAAHDSDTGDRLGHHRQAFIDDTGRIWYSWNQVDGDGVIKIMCSYSDDNGDTWTEEEIADEAAFGVLTAVELGSGFGQANNGEMVFFTTQDLSTYGNDRYHIYRREAETWTYKCSTYAGHSSFSAYGDMAGALYNHPDDDDIWIIFGTARHSSNEAGPGYSISTDNLATIPGTMTLFGAYTSGGSGDQYVDRGGGVTFRSADKRKIGMVLNIGVSAATYLQAITLQDWDTTPVEDSIVIDTESSSGYWTWITGAWTDTDTFRFITVLGGFSRTDVYRGVISDMWGTPTVDSYVDTTINIDSINTETHGGYYDETNNLDVRIGILSTSASWQRNSYEASAVDTTDTFTITGAAALSSLVLVGMNQSLDYGYQGLDRYGPVEGIAAITRAAYSGTRIHRYVESDDLVMGEGPPLPLVASPEGCVPDNEAMLSFRYEIFGPELSSLSFSYDLGVSDEEYADLVFAYELVPEGGVTWEPTVTPYGYMTQVIGNQYPYWHAGQAKVGGRTQRVVNSLGGFHLTELMHKFRKLRANMFLGTVDLSEPHKAWMAARPVALRDQEKPRNLLLNPGFSRVIPQRLGPWAWNDGLISSTGDWELKRGTGLYGYYGFRASVDDGESVTLSQPVGLVLRAGQAYTATVWYAGMRPDRSIPDASRSSGPRLQLSTQYSSGEVGSTSVFLKDDTGGLWTRASVAFTPVSDTHSVDVSLVVQDYEGESVVMEFGGAQLELGNKSTPFMENTFDEGMLYLLDDKAETTESTAWGDITYYRQQRVRVDDYYDWNSLQELPADRALVSVAPDNTVATQQNVLGATVDVGGRTFSLGWRINNGLIESYNADIRQNEVCATFLVADLYGDGEPVRMYHRPVDLGVTQTYEAICTSRDWLYIVVKEVYLGKTHRVLKVCAPYARWDANGYLESVADIYLDDGTGTVIDIGLIEGRSDQLLIQKSGDDFSVVDLLWDSAARTSDGHVVFRKDPGSAILVT